VIPVCRMGDYLAYLLDRFVSRGGTTRQTQSDLTSWGQIINSNSRVRAVVNCTGLGARKLANDPAVHPVRGHIIALSPTVKSLLQYSTLYHDDDSSSGYTYFIPRKDYCLVGGSREESDSTEIDPVVIQDIKKRIARFLPNLHSHFDSHTLTQWVGVRPARRGGPRVELVNYHSNQETTITTPTTSIRGDQRDCVIVHNYGHSGLGVTLSWGCAFDVLEKLCLHFELPVSGPTASL